jgi:hypothetical protein
MRSADSGADIGAALEGSSCKKMSKYLVRWGQAEKGNSTSSKTTCWSGDLETDNLCDLWSI